MICFCAQAKLSCLDYTFDPSAFQPNEEKPPAPGVNIDTVNNSCKLLGSNFSGKWETRRTFVITAGNSIVLVRYLGKYFSD